VLGGAGRSSHRSWWLRRALAAERTEPPPASVDGTRTDVAVVGGGFVGLWTALRLRELEPGRRVVVVEADICGGGASGRNGGFVLSWLPKLGSLVAACGEQEALRLVDASLQAVDIIEGFCARHAPDAGFRRGGWLWTATSPAHIGAWEGVTAIAARLRPGAFEPLSPAEVAARSGSPNHLAGVLDRSGATVQPAVLVRALRRHALERGVEIVERTHARLERSSPPRLHTSRGTLTADRVVIATNAWAAGLRELRRDLFVISSDMVITEPVPERLEATGWVGGEGITDSQTLVCYYRTTGDGRVAFGKGGWAIGLGGWMPPAMTRHPGRAGMVAADFHRYYPMLRDVPIAADWAGPVDRTYDSLPIFGHLGGREDITYGVGWSGNGVGPSAVGGRILASLALGRDDEWSTAGLVRAAPRRFPPEPIRYAGAHLVREALIRKERTEAVGAAPGRIATALSRLAPSGLEDK